jgi:S-DNA-T family DNA segregation ATPase FtsK/SpoIIIE
MQVRTTRAGEVVGVGSINHAELARLQTAAKRKTTKSSSPSSKAADEPLDESEDEIEDEKPEPKTAAKPTS